MISPRKKSWAAKPSGSDKCSDLWAAIGESVRVIAKHTQTYEAVPPGIVVGSTTGPKRENNEDRAGTFVVSGTHSPVGPFYLAVLCDGIGGERDGERSAWTALSAFTAKCALSSEPTPQAILMEAVHYANDCVHDFTKGQGGTTLVAALMDLSGHITGINCGDSRIYRFSKNTDLRQLTHDQTVAAAIEKAAGSLPEDVLPHGFGENLGNFIGIGRDLAPEYLHFDDFSKDEVLILSSDGIWNALNGHFPRILHAAPTVSEAVKRCLAVVNFTGGSDNASLVAFSPRAVQQAHLSAASTTARELRLSGAFPAGALSISVIRSTMYSTESPPKKSLDTPLKRQKTRAKKKVLEANSQTELPIDENLGRISLGSDEKRPRPRIEVVDEEERNGNDRTTEKSSR